MGRQYKFRAYCDKRKEFVRIIDLGLFGTGQIKEVAFTYKDEPYERVSCELPGDVKLIEYTGLKDKNGVEIYEGDIIENDGDDTHEVVTFDEGSFWLEGSAYTTPLYQVNTEAEEVIGNIYEHHDLLGDNQ